ncbi:midnolin homolog [Planococcus citri]|uniref:midnolin homolog n=1 Tax=Planococcus citri TaxID=170843 RepID=UPI0031F8FB45
MMDNSINRERCDDHRQSLFQNGCGYSPTITITVNPTTGGQFNLDMGKNDTIENLKRIISKKLKVSRDRICLLYRERQLKEGTLEENEVIDGSRLTLLPIVETGLTAQKPELSVMNALESLNEAQVNDFLSGKQPLNLTMRLGDHMMLIQLMLSTISNQSHGSSSSSSSSSASSSRSKSTEEVSKSIPPAAAAAAVAAAAAAATSVATEEPTTLENEKSAESFLYTASASTSTTTTTTTSTSTRLEKILSSSSSSSSGTSANCTSKSTNVRQKEIDRDDSQHGTRLGTAAAAGVAATPSIENEALAATSSVSRLAEKRTSEFRTYDECKRARAAARNGSDNADASASSSSSSSCTCTSCPRVSSLPTTSTIFDASTTAASCTLDSVALSEATRNLTQTLKKLSSEVLTSKRTVSVPQKFKSLRSNVMHYKRKPNAIIENMNHHGRGIYSGTFSGTLNPALQDRHGRPKKDVSTIIHILNDLLCANPRPQCRKSSCACNNAGDSSSNGSNSSSSMVINAPSTSSSNTANDEQTNSTAQVPAPSTTASATPARNEIVDAVSKRNENQTTRNKMKQLKSIMEERKEKRKAKRVSPYERPFPCIDLISSRNLNSSGAWSGPSSDSAKSIEPDPSPSILSEPVIA